MGLMQQQQQQHEHCQQTSGKTAISCRLPPSAVTGQMLRC